MPIIVHYSGANPDVVKGTNWKQLDEATARIGCIVLTDLRDGHKIIVNKSAWVKVDEIAESDWEARIAADKKAREDQDAAVKKQAEEQKARMEKARLDGIRDRKPINRIRKFFGRAAK